MTVPTVPTVSVLSEEDIKVIYNTVRPNELGFFLPNGEYPPAVAARFELVRAAVLLAQTMLKG